MLNHDPILDLEVTRFEYGIDSVDVARLELPTEEVFSMHFPKKWGNWENDDPQLVNVGNSWNLKSPSQQIFRENVLADPDDLKLSPETLYKFSETPIINVFNGSEIDYCTVKQSISKPLNTGGREFSDQNAHIQMADGSQSLDQFPWKPMVKITQVTNTIDISVDITPGLIRTMRGPNNEPIYLKQLALLNRLRPPEL